MKKLTLVAMLALGMIFTACGGETSTVDGDGGSDGYETTEYTDGDSGGDVVETEQVDEGVTEYVDEGVTETADGDSTEVEVEVEVEVVNPCAEGYAALYINDVEECVEESFAQVVTDIDGMVFVREVDDKEFAIAVRHISFADFDVDACPDSTYFITNLKPMNTVCLEDDLSLSLCKNDASLCGGEQVTEGSIHFNSTDSTYSINYLTVWSDGQQQFKYNQL